MPRCRIGPTKPISFGPALEDVQSGDQWGWRGDNPVKGIRRYDEQKRHRWLQDDELQRLVRVLDEHPNQRAANAVRLQLLTGARMGEVLSARKADFDLGRGVWIKPSHQTKQRRTEHLPLSAPAASLVAGIIQENSESLYLFPGNVPGEHLTDIKKFWAAASGKRTSPTTAATTIATPMRRILLDGLSLEVVGRLLGHTSPSTTKRYAHLADDPRRAATERFASKFGTYSA